MFLLRFSACIFLLLFTFVSAKAQKENLSGVINIYTRVTGIDYCKKTISVATAFGFAAGDKAILIQMKGAAIDTSNSAAFGTVQELGGAGNAEVVEISSVQGLTLTLKYTPVMDYFPDKAPVQLVSLPGYDTAIITSRLTAKPWDGITGGVLAFDVRVALDLAGSIDISGRGFRGGISNLGRVNTQIFSAAGFRYNRQSLDSAGEKGENIAELSDSYRLGRGAPANGGGGGNAHNAGGGGGGNGGRGGNGSFEFGSNPIRNGGLGGYALDYAQPRLFMGGGGGAGHQNNAVGTNGGAGGGIAFIRANVLVIRPGARILANGEDILQVAGNDGCGGGGGGGSVFFDVQRFIFYTPELPIEARGGNGGDTRTTVDKHGPGAGGGGGMIAFLFDTPTQVTTNLSGGQAGRNTSLGNDSYGAEAGQNGIVKTFFRLPESKRTELLISTGNDTSVCARTPILLTAQARGGRAPYTYTWSGNGIDDPNAQNTLIRPDNSGFYTVTVKDSFGCTITGRINITVQPAPTLNLPARDFSACQGDTIVLTANSPESLEWLPADDLLETRGNTVRMIARRSRTYTVRAQTQAGCAATDTIKVNVFTQPTVNRSFQRLYNICVGDSISLDAAPETGTPPFRYFWSGLPLPYDTLSPIVKLQPQNSGIYYLIIKDSNGCVSAKDSVIVSVKPLPVPNAGPDTAICAGRSVQLQAADGIRFRWSPSAGLSNDTIANPVASPLNTTLYTVRVWNSGECSTADSVLITVYPAPPQPILRRSADTLFVSPGGQEYEWFHNDRSILRSTDSMFIVPETGNYFVRITTSQGCTAVSDTLFVAIGSARLRIGSGSVKIANTIDVPIILDNKNQVELSGSSAIEMEIAWNSNVLIFDGVQSPNPSLQLQRQGDSMILKLLIPLNGNSADSILGYMNFRGVLGTDSQSVLNIRQARSLNGRIRFSTQNGLITIDGICYEGGIRLWKSDEQFAVAALRVNPHPANAQAQITLELPEKGAVRILACDINGREIILHSAMMIPGLYTLPLLASLLHDGLWFFKLETPTGLFTVPVYIFL
jgi:hypothetical protein